MTTTFRRRECVFIVGVGGNKTRPGVIVSIDLEEGTAVVIWGTSTERPELPHVKVLPQQPAGHALRLSGPTFFYAEGVQAVTIDRLRKGSGNECPPLVFQSLRLLAGHP